MPFPRLHLDPEHEMFRDQVRRYLKDNMADKVAKWRDQAHVDREDFKAFGDNGWLCLWARWSAVLFYWALLCWDIWISPQRCIVLPVAI
ncbi:MAG: acyl-CoA dehydrogenase family protein, partial [Pseudooceanicola atlanticus]